MSLLANINSKKKYSPKDFNPYSDVDGSKMPKTKEEAMELKEAYSKWQVKQTQ